MICSFIGHSLILSKILSNSKLENDLKDKILKLITFGIYDFYVGTHGDFDKLVLRTLVSIKKEIFDRINIFAVQTNLNILKNKYQNNNKYYKYIFFDIEDIYYKNIITFSNKKMIDKCQYLICYINENKKYSRAKKFYNYAKNNNKIIINLFHF